MHVLIRSRAEHGDFLDRPEEFVYSADEVASMARQAGEAVTAGAAGVVIGALTQEGELDLPALETLRDGALTAGSDALRGVHLTVHRALDALPGRAQRAHAVQTLLGLGIHRVLTSGARTGARRRRGPGRDGRRLGGPAGRLRRRRSAPADIADLARRAGLADVHLSARRRPGAPVERGAPETCTDPAIVAAAVDAAGEL